MKLTVQQYDVLSRYAKGADAASIAYATGLKAGEVAKILTDWCEGSPERARLVLAEDDARSGLKRAPAAPSAAPGAHEPTPVPNSLAVALAAGQAHDQPRIRALATRLQASLVSLQAAIEHETTIREARGRVERLEAELAEARRALGRPGPSAGAVDSPAIRRWARDHNVACPALGRVPRAVVEAYEAARAGVSDGR